MPEAKENGWNKLMKYRVFEGVEDLCQKRINDEERYDGKEKLEK